MLIRCWGARGSITVSGKEYNKYGGDTTCIEITTKDGENIIIDAGTGIRRLGNKMISTMNNYHIIFTHSHWDHLLGFPFFKPIYKEGNQINIYGCPFAQEGIRRIFSDSTVPPFFPADYSHLKAKITYHGAVPKNFNIGDMEIHSIPLSHPNQGFGYKFIEDGKTFVFLTDNELTYQHPGGLLFEEYLQFSKNADFLIHDSEFTEEEYKNTRTWGHSTFNKSIELAIKANTKNFGLFHHNQDHIDEKIDEILNESLEIINSQNSNLKCFALYTGFEFQL